ncbi:DUF459 domain-containing protein [Mesorhizobium sp. CAU 1741]|uniref:SGNH/GDSL hydrolase family protein n=1 Tax=Mesorhizobium sp. CAU 1741 TaxID=3140366 RepID=UPI00325A7180
MSAFIPASSRILRFLFIALALAMAAPAGGGFVGIAHAQQAGERSGGGILRFLFQRRDRQDRVAPQATPRREPAPVRRSQSTTPSPPPAPKVEKAEDAKRVLVVGDFMASGLADGLAEAFAEEQDVIVVDSANGSSGLVRDDHYDWPGNIGSVLESESPDIVVVMIGSNDRQQMLVDGNREQPLSEAWLKEYERRATALAKVIRDKSLPLIWVGNLPFRPGAMSSDMIAFNDVYRRIVTDAGGEYVDVWEGFVDETGAFVANGPDMNGQPAQLRASDGINVTRQGRRKIAFYVEKPLDRLLDIDPQEPGAIGIGPDMLNGIVPLDGEPVEIDRTLPIAIEDLGGGSSGLLGAVTTPTSGKAKTAAERLTHDGIAPEARPGRADDFVVGRPPQPSPETTTAVTP